MNSIANTETNNNVIDSTTNGIIEAFRTAIERHYPVGSGDWHSGYVAGYEYHDWGVAIKKANVRGSGLGFKSVTMSKHYKRGS